MGLECRRRLRDWLLKLKKVEDINPSMVIKNTVNDIDMSVGYIIKNNKCQYKVKLI
jgi:hypothetical protein